MKIFILNDTSKGQSGSQECMRYIYKELLPYEIIGIHYCGETFIDMKEFRECDLVLANGEGTMHHNAPKAEFIMTLLELAQKAKKKTMLVNTVWQGMSDTWQKTLDKMDYICVREIKSSIAIRTSHDVIPDFSFHVYSNLKNKITKGKSKMVCKGETHPDTRLHGILDYIKLDSVTLTKPFSEVVIDLTRYNKYITGQHHGVYAAIMAEINFMPIPSNTWKIESLLQWIGDQNPIKFLEYKWKGFSLDEKIREIS